MSVLLTLCLLSLVSISIYPYTSLFSTYLLIVCYSTSIHPSIYLSTVTTSNPTPSPSPFSIYSKKGIPNKQIPFYIHPPKVPSPESRIHSLMQQRPEEEKNKPKRQALPKSEQSPSPLSLCKLPNQPRQERRIIHNQKEEDNNPEERSTRLFWAALFIIIIIIISSIHILNPLSFFLSFPHLHLANLQSAPFETSNNRLCYLDYYRISYPIVYPICNPATGDCSGIIIVSMSMSIPPH